MAIHTINPAETSALTFSDEFNALSLYNPATGAAGTWNPLLRGFNPEGSSNIWGHEVQFNVNPYFDYNRNGIDDTPSPFTVKDGVLTITAKPMDPVFKADVNLTITEGYWPTATRMTYDYSSGFLSTANSFSQTYGYFEMRAQLAPGAGMWSAFWLLPQDGTWPPELDVVELLGRDPTTSYHSVHSTEGPHGHSMASGSLTGLDATGSFHTYGLNWQSDYLTYYVDGQQVFKTATPSDMNKPMYMIANLAIGESGSWSGGVDASTTFPAEMKIDYIRAYSSMPVDPVVPAPVAPVTTAPVPLVEPVEPASVLTFSDEFNALSLYNPATGAAGTWNPLLRGFNPEGSSNIWGHEVQFNVNPYFDYNRNGIDDTPSPFTVKDGVLTITAKPMDPVFKADVNLTITEGYWPTATRMTYDYSSGFLSTANSFSQTYGYFEMRAQLAPGAGMWSAFWLLPQDGTWPPELDVVELLGRDPTTSYHSVHSTEGPHGHSMASGSLTGLDATGSFHTYGLNWQSDYLTYYVDGQQVFKTATPSDMNKPMYMIANLAIGESGSWSGGVDASTTFPAEMKIDYIRAYSSMPVDPVVPAPVEPVTTAPVAHASVAPVTTAPVDPVVPAPVAPVTTAPVPPVPPVEPVEPVETVAHEPAEAVEPAPVAHASVAPVTIAPVDPVVAPPVSPVEPAPADGKFVYDIPLNDDAALVYRIYQASFARAPDEPGFRFWYDVREEQGLTFYDMANCFRISPEFTQKYDANISNNDYVSLLYGNVLQRTPDTLGLLFWQDVLNSGYYDCNEMMLAFAESPENVLLTTPNIVDGYWLV